MQKTAYEMRIIYWSSDVCSSDLIDTYYLLILLEYGVLGFLIFYGLFLTGIWKAGRTLFDLGPTDREVSLLIPLIIAMSNWLIIKSIFAQADRKSTRLNSSH